jgi:hypothetical protein
MTNKPGSKKSVPVRKLSAKKPPSGHVTAAYDHEPQSARQKTRTTLVTNRTRAKQRKKG